MQNHETAGFSVELAITFGFSKLARRFEFRRRKGDEMPATVDAEAALEAGEVG